LHAAIPTITETALPLVGPKAAASEPPAPPSGWRSYFADCAEGLGDWSLFAYQAATGVFTRHMKGRELLRVCIEVGVNSVGVVAITGAFIGMVLAVQTYSQFHIIGLDTSIGAVIHMSVVRELGPVLAATMLAGRIGTAMAAQLATMRVTEQIDALACLGVDPVRYLVSPRFLGCLLMIPLLTVLADLMGVVGSTLICLKVFHIDGFLYWQHTANFVKSFDLLVGIVKAVIFGGVLCLICCHRGFNSRAGAVGVGRAATEGFVLSFVAIMALDFLMAMLTNAIHNAIWPVGSKIA